MVFQPFFEFAVPRSAPRLRVARTGLPYALAFLGLLSLTPSPAAADVIELGTDRDAFTPSTLTVPPGSVLTEGSYVYIDNRDQPATNSYPELLTRAPVADWLELLTAVENGGAGRSKMVALGGVDLP